ncbi:MAG: DNRLRE domain-containing protein [Verrucomicrobiota bacterium JB024]|nr:DNRLRE domain-containing protein [Verrucomicrobiota bacterium JB024]
MKITTPLKLALALIVTGAASLLQAETVTISSTDSVYIRAEVNRNADEFMLVGQTTTQSDYLRGLFTFDLSSTGVDFSAVTINSVTITLTVGRGDASSLNSDVTLNLYNLTQDYTASSTTWSKATSSENWTTPGGTYDPAVVANVAANPTTVTAGETITLSSTALNDLVANSDGSVDFLLKLATENASVREIFFFGRGGATEYAAPSITVNYTIPEASNLGLLGGILLLAILLGKQRFRRQ